MKKIIHILLILIFILFAYVQWNDPDPIRWILIYLGVSISGVLYLMNWKFQLLPMLGLIVCAGGMIYLFPDFINWIRVGMPTIVGSMKAESPHIEFVREFLGFIVTGLAYFYYFKLHRRTH